MEAARVGMQSEESRASQCGQPGAGTWVTPDDMQGKPQKDKLHTSLWI